MTQFELGEREREKGRKREQRRGEGGRNVLELETFLIVHSHSPYVTRAGHVTGLCSRGSPASCGKPGHYLRYSAFFTLI